jgi:dTDP-glucose pyrophosphorylase
MQPPTILITMAGQGQRFQQAGYTVPKYEIEVKGKTLFNWALSSLQNFFQPDCHVIFIARQEFTPTAFIGQECKRLGIERYDTVLLDQLTDGQASTVLHAARAPVRPKAPILIYNIDTHVDPRFLDPASMQGDGWIPCFPGKGDGWSFVRVDADNRALEVREKQRISPHATIGLYGFSSFENFETIYKDYYANPDNLEHKERYIAPLYNHLIENGCSVFISELPEDAVYPLGTPEEVETFRKNPYTSHSEVKISSCN